MTLAGFLKLTKELEISIAHGIKGFPPSAS